jgi:hypothetical protein
VTPVHARYGSSASDWQRGFMSSLGRTPRARCLRCCRRDGTRSLRCCSHYWCQHAAPAVEQQTHIRVLSRPPGHSTNALPPPPTPYHRALVTPLQRSPQSSLQVAALRMASSWLRSLDGLLDVSGLRAVGDAVAARIIWSVGSATTAGAELVGAAGDCAAKLTTGDAALLHESRAPIRTVGVICAVMLATVALMAWLVA